jgi:hypothetical protein
MHEEFGSAELQFGSGVIVGRDADLEIGAPLRVRAPCGGHARYSGRDVVGQDAGSETGAPLGVWSRLTSAATGAA